MATEEILTDKDFQNKAPQVLSDSDFAGVSTGKPATATISPPPVPNHSAYLSDKDMSLTYPSTMTHDQVNDAAQTEIYGRPRNTFFFDPNAPEAPARFAKAFTEGAGPLALDFGLNIGQTEPKAVPEIAKAPIQGVEDIFSHVGGLLKWIGESVQNQGNENDDEFAKNLGKSTTEVGARARQYWQDQLQEGATAPDTEIFRGTFLSNPSFTRLAAGVARGIPMLAGAALVSHAALAAGLTEAAASFIGAGGLGLLSGGETYAQSREHGTDSGKASTLAGLSVIGNTILAALPLNKVLSRIPAGKSVARNAVEGSIAFGTASLGTTALNNFLDKVGGDKTREITAGMIEALLAAVVSGGILGGFSPGHGQALDQKTQDAYNAGVPAKHIDNLRSAIAQHLVENSGTIEKIIRERFEPSGENQYFKNEVKGAFEDFGKKPGTIETGKEIVKKIIGAINAQIVRGHHLAIDIEKSVPSETEQKAMFFYAEADGDKAVIQAAIENEKFEPYKKALEKALDLSPEALHALHEGEKFYNETGQVSEELGTIRQIRENYRQSRIYKPEKEGEEVKLDTGKSLKQTTPHGKQRVYDNIFEAIENGKELAEYRYPKVLAIHNEEMARVNTMRGAVDTLAQKNGSLMQWKRSDNIPDGWEQVGTMRKSVPIKKNGEPVIGEDGNQLHSESILTAPKGIVKSLRPLTDPDWIRLWMEAHPRIKGAFDYQALEKAGNLALSLFHHLTFVTQTLSAPEGWRTLAESPKMDEVFMTPEFRQLEVDWARENLMTSTIHKNLDVFQDLRTGDDWMTKLAEKPIIKQTVNAVEANNKFLFDRLQRFLKVMTAEKAFQEWIGKNPEAADGDISKARFSISKTVNAEFGGLSWETMGVDKTTRTILRMGLLAPDWLVSMLASTKYMFERSAGGSLSRSIFAKAVVGGYLANQALNYVINGAFTNQNSKGHQIEAKLAPHVYLNFIRGAPGELFKLASMMYESGIQRGFFRYFQGKLAAIPRTAMMALGGVDYYGKSIYQGKSKFTQAMNGAINILSNLLPTPFSATGIIKYGLDEAQKTALGWTAVSTGLGRYSAPPDNLFSRFLPKESKSAKGFLGEKRQKKASGLL